MKKIIDVCTRVEGHGTINFLLQKDEISSVYFEMEPIVGFENILINKKAVDVPKIVSRICGLCHASQTIASCKALEQIFEIEPSEESILVRRLLMCAELIKSHSLHFFFQSFPDLLTIIKNKDIPFSTNDLLSHDPKLTSNFFELIKIGQRIGELLGGRPVHHITPTIGGVLYTPSKKDINIVRKYFQTALNTLNWTIEKVEGLFLQTDPPDEYKLPNPVFMGIQNNENFNQYDGNLRFKQKNNILTNIPLEKFSQYLDKNPDSSKVYIHLKDTQDLLVGPISRYNVIENYKIDGINTYIDSFGNAWRDSFLFWSILQLLEMLVVTYQGLSIIENANFGQASEIPTFNSIKNHEGLGIVEAPRGTLIHYYEINDKQMIERVKLYIPTGLNIPIINKILTEQSRMVFEKTQNIHQVKKQAQMILRCFDPCIACAVNYVQRT